MSSVAPLLGHRGATRSALDAALQVLNDGRDQGRRETSCGRPSEAVSADSSTLFAVAAGPLGSLSRSVGVGLPPSPGAGGWPEAGSRPLARATKR